LSIADIALSCGFSTLLILVVSSERNLANRRTLIEWRDRRANRQQSPAIANNGRNLAGTQLTD
jgi:hypothetical protein